MNLILCYILAVCEPPVVFTESTGMTDSNREAYARCEHLLIQAGKAGADVDPRRLWEWCMVQTGAAI